MKTFLNSILCLLLSGSYALATLTATVNSGYTFTEGERPTVASLNQLGEPTVTISGTVDGSTGLTAGSVTGTLLADGLPDGITLDWNSAGPRQLEVMLQGIHTNNLDTNVWRWPLQQSSPSQKVQLVANPHEFTTNASGLSLLFDPTTRTNANNGVGVRYDPVQMTTNPAGLAVAYDTKCFTTNSSGLTLTNFMSSELTMQILATNGACVTVSHGLGRAPSSVRVVFVCISADNGYVAGDEVDVLSIRDSASAGIHFNVVANSTSVYLIQFSAGGNTALFNKSSGAQFTLSTASSNWHVKVYARL